MGRGAVPSRANIVRPMAKPMNPGAAAARSQRRTGAHAPRTTDAGASTAPGGLNDGGAIGATLQSIDLPDIRFDAGILYFLARADHHPRTQVAIISVAVVAQEG